METDKPAPVFPDEFLMVLVVKIADVEMPITERNQFVKVASDTFENR
jgi:hypothetical protein